jgi:hypothetical protein
VSGRRWSRQDRARRGRRDRPAAPASQRASAPAGVSENATGAAPDEPLVATLEAAEEVPVKGWDDGEVAQAASSNAPVSTAARTQRRRPPRPHSSPAIAGFFARCRCSGHHFRSWHLRAQRGRGKRLARARQLTHRRPHTSAPDRSCQFSMGDATSAAYGPTTDWCPVPSMPWLPRWRHRQLSTRSHLDRPRDAVIQDQGDGHAEKFSQQTEAASSRR